MEKERIKSLNYTAVHEGSIGGSHTFFVKSNQPDVCGLVEERRVTITDHSSYECSCRRPFHFYYPCRHVICCGSSPCIPAVHKPVPHPAYLLKYYYTVYTSVSVRIPAITSIVRQEGVLPPVLEFVSAKKSSKKRIRSEMELPSSRQRFKRWCCSRCGKEGHNRRSCKA